MAERKVTLARGGASSAPILETTQVPKVHRVDRSVVKGPVVLINVSN